MVQKTWRSVGLTLVVVALLASAAGCGSPQPEPTLSPTEVAAAVSTAVEELVVAYPLAATVWDLDYFGPPEQRSLMLPDTQATVVYFWERYAGFDGCNWFLGVYSATAEGELRMQTPARTDYLCGPEQLYQQSVLYSSSLEVVTEYRLEGGQLIANTTDDQRLLTFNPAKPVPTLGTEWALALWWIDDNLLWRPAVPNSTTTITFGQGGEASGSGGCNGYTVSYEGDLQIEKVMEATDTYAELPTLTFGPVTTQFVACAEPEDIMDQEQAFFTALGSVAYYFKLGNMLMLVNSEGTPIVALGARR